jgi:phosphohistidine phosphatase SixA
MNRRTQTMAAIALLLLNIGCTPSTAQSPQTTPPSVTAPATDIWAQMREGTGYVVLMRHAQTEPGTGDPPGFRLEDCATQRNLSAEGKAQAERIGQTFRDRQIPIVQVLSSQYCRCLDTASLLDLSTVESAPMLNSTFTDQANETKQKEQVQQQIMNHRSNPGVIIMVTHFVNIGAISGISPSSGDAVVVKANEQGKLEVAGQLQDL